MTNRYDETTDGRIALTIFIGAVLFIFGVYLWSQRPSINHYSASDDRNYQECLPEYVGVPPSTVDGVSGDNGEKSQEHHNACMQRSDLAAQWATADFTFFGIGVGVLGLLFLGYSLYETRKASRFASKALAATERAAKAEFQPYLSIGKPTLKFPPNITTTSAGSNYVRFKCEAKIKISNIGKTPAENFFVSSGYIVWIGIASHENFSEIDDITKFSTRTVKRSSTSIKMGEPSLLPGKHFNHKVNLDVRIPISEWAESDADPLKATARFSLGIRVSFVDNFIDGKRFNGRYQRRVVVADFGSFTNDMKINPMVMDLEVEPEDVDYPEEHDKSSGYGFMHHFGSGALGVIRVIGSPKTK